MAINVVTSNMADQVAHWASDANALDVASGINVNVVIQYPAAGAGMHHIIEGIVWSYDGGNQQGATGTTLRVADGATVTFDIDIIAAGWGYVPVRKRGTANTAMTITLLAGGVGTTTKLNIIGHRLD